MRETRQLTAVRVGPGAIQVDGSLDDPGWAGVAFTAEFLQKRRVDGAALSQPTEVAVAFDDTAWWNAASGIARRCGRTTRQEATKWVERLELLAQPR